MTVNELCVHLHNLVAALPALGDAPVVVRDLPNEWIVASEVKVRTPTWPEAAPLTGEGIKRLAVRTLYMEIKGPYD